MPRDFEKRINSLSETEKLSRIETIGNGLMREAGGLKGSPK